MTEPSPFALISGASSGIGLELAKHLTHRGYELVITAEDAELCTAAQMRASRNELGPSGVSVTALLPGSPGSEFSLERAWGTTP